MCVYEGQLYRRRSRRQTARKEKCATFPLQQHRREKFPNTCPRFACVELAPSFCPPFLLLFKSSLSASSWSSDNISTLTGARAKNTGQRYTTSKSRQRKSFRHETVTRKHTPSDEGRKPGCTLAYREARGWKNAGKRNGKPSPVTLPGRSSEQRMELNWQLKQHARYGAV